MKKIQRSGTRPGKTAYGLMIALAMIAGATTVNAQIGTGWTHISPSTHIVVSSTGSGYHMNYPGSSTSISDGGGRYTYVNGIRTFQLLDTSRNRVEFVFDDFYSDKRQLQLTAMVSSPANNESILQLFCHQPDGPYLLIKESNSSSGSLRVVGDGVTTSTTIATGIYGVWVRLNTIHNKSANLTQVYVNGTKKFQQGWGPGTSYYDKFGCYGTLTTSSAKIQFKSVTYFK